jgi:hypothetical protein
VSGDDISVILHRLDEMASRLEQIHEEVRRTNGRVTELEIQEAWWKGKEEAKRPYGTVITTVVAYGLLAVIAWFVGKSV